MKTLLLANSSIGRRRVLPALASLGVTCIDIASRRGSAAVTLPPGVSGRTFDDYIDAIERSDAELVYVSTVNSLHAELAAAALSAGRHVVIDKPTTTALTDLHGLVQLARRHRRLVAEANVYAHHPQIVAARRAFEDAGSQPTKLAAIFSYPPLPPENFRLRPALGGGALHDLGPYAISVGRLFFNAAPLEIIARHDTEDRAFSMLAVYPGERSMVGHFGMTTGYANRLELLGPGMTVIMERVFTTPPDVSPVLRVTHDDRSREICVPPADSFAVFLAAVFTAIARDDTERFIAPMVADAEALQRLRAASGVGIPPLGGCK